jgi:type VI protein secretion system component VasF
VGTPVKADEQVLDDAGAGVVIETEDERFREKTYDSLNLELPQETTAEQPEIAQKPQEASKQNSDAKMPIMQKVVLICAAVLIIGFFSFYYVLKPLFFG